jgi:hypothetical protein
MYIKIPVYLGTIDYVLIIAVVIFAVSCTSRYVCHECRLRNNSPASRPYSPNIYDCTDLRSSAWLAAVLLCVGFAGWLFGGMDSKPVFDELNTI